MVGISGQSIAAALFMASLLSPAAAAQTVQVSSSESLIGFTGGVSIDPEQRVVGVFWQTPEIGGRFHLRPGLDGGFGDGVKVATVNVDFIARFPLGASGWDFIQGGGPAIVVTRFDVFGATETDVGAGGTYIIGFGHQSGFLGEFRIGGGGNVPSLKLTAGYAIGF